jgi:dephospho-CoA kinase
MSTATPPHRLTASPPHRLSFLPSDEPILFSTRPGFLFVLIYRQGWWLIPPLVLWGAHWVLARLFPPDPVPQLVLAAGAWFVVGFFCRVIAWLSRRYILTDRRALVVAGVLSRAAGDVPLRSIQHTTVTQSILEHLFGLGTVGVATAGSGGAAINWLMVARPQEVLDRIRRATDAAKRSPVRAGPSQPATTLPGHPPVIGLAGAPGSGKSEAARILQSLGAVVIDSDREAKEALDRPNVRDRLVQWWGTGILTRDGRVNRKAVADIIFNDPEQRAHLESVVHPIVRARRDDARRLAQERGATAVIVDAPLLFEAGVDKECDVVLFIDAPPEARLARVRARGWDQAELSRREASQLPLEEKKRRSDLVIGNDGSIADLERGVEAAFRRIVQG